MSPLNADNGPGRLNGWKDIARHLGKGTRTVQRWEKLYGLPVHRIGREGGEIVFAFPDEIDRWVTATEVERAANGHDMARPPGPDRDGGEANVVPGRPGRRLAVAGALLLLVAAAILALSGLRRALPAGDRGRVTASRPSGLRQPAEWRLENERLLVLDAAGGLVFEHPFGFPLAGSHRSADWAERRASAPVQIADVDGDGRSEVLVLPMGEARESRRLYCFEADGRLRFSHQPTGRVRYGETEYAEPWLAHRVFVTRGPDGRRSIWAVFTHNLWFPTRLQELGVDGSVRQEYWSDGYVELVSEVTWKGRHVVLVGGTNNDWKGASLAVFARDGVRGRAPAVRPPYACRDCPPGGPDELLVFPTLCLIRSARGQATLVDAWVEGGDRIRVSVLQSRGGTGRHESVVFYTLGPDLSLVAADLSVEFGEAHQLAEKQGALDHRFGRRDDADMFPVRRWNGRAFVELPPVPVGH